MTVSNLGQNLVSSSTGFSKWKVALIFMYVSLNPRMMPFRSFSGIGFHLTLIDFWSVFTAVTACGGESGAEEEEERFHLIEWCYRDL